jgi:hypothetical protein
MLFPPLICSSILLGAYNNRMPAQPLSNATGSFTESLIVGDRFCDRSSQIS